MSCDFNINDMVLIIAFSFGLWYLLFSGDGEE